MILNILIGMTLAIGGIVAAMLFVMGFIATREIIRDKQRRKGIDYEIFPLIDFDYEMFPLTVIAMLAGIGLFLLVVYVITVVL